MKEFLKAITSAVISIFCIFLILCFVKTTPIYYFRDCKIQPPTAFSTIPTEHLPYTKTSVFSDFRKEFEAMGVIPSFNDYGNYTCVANYLKSGELYSVSSTWQRLISGDSKQFGSISITAAPNIIELFDEYVETSPPFEFTTVTKRCGTNIYAAGLLNSHKAVIFQNEHGWYRIETYGSWNNSYKEIIDIMKYIMKNPVDFSQFVYEKGDNHEWSVTLEEKPDAFLGYYPDLTNIGFSIGNNTMDLENGAPVNIRITYSNKSNENINYFVCTTPNRFIYPDDPIYEFDNLSENIAESYIQLKKDDFYIRISCDTNERLNQIIKIIKEMN